MIDVEKLPIEATLSLGMDMGIGSSGIAALEPDAVSGLSVRCFPVPEKPKNKELLNVIRRTNRLMRRQTHRRRIRRNALARLLEDHLPLCLFEIRRRDSVYDIATRKPLDPWQMRHDGLDRKLAPVEFVAALMHIAKRRGFKSNSKSVQSGNDAEGGKALKGMAAMAEKAQPYRSTGEMLWKDPVFAAKKRNRPNDYSHTVKREQMEAEANLLFHRQRQLGNGWASEELRDKFIDTAFFQLPLQASEHLVGFCPFEPGERRASAQAPGFEKFRYLSKVNTLSVVDGDGVLRRLNDDEKRRAAALFGRSKSITYKTLRKALNMHPDDMFYGVPREKPKKGSLHEGSDVCLSKGCCAGTDALKKAIGAHLGDMEWARHLADPEMLDTIAFTIAFREEIRHSGHGRDQSIETGLRDRGIPEDLIGLLLDAVEKRVFKDFKGAGNISAKAARAINDPLMTGLVYSEACARVGYDHARQAEESIDDIRNPVVRQVLRECWRHLMAVLRDLGARPARITIEMARDVGKPVDVRKAMEDDIKAKRAEKEEMAEEYRQLVGKDPIKEELLAYKLWKEQKHCCVYSGAAIDCRDLDLSRRRVEIDHILPRSRSQDNSYHNKVLCLTSMNQAKRNRSPHEWMTDAPHPDAMSWERFSAWVEQLDAVKGMKKRNLLMRNFAEREASFCERNMNDTRHAIRVFRSMVERLYRNDPVDPKTGRRRRRVFTRPGAITAVVRRAWGLEELKKDETGQRIGDLHHAVDAAVVAALGDDEALTQQLTRIHQKLESRGLAMRVDDLPLPWTGFREDLKAALDQVFVSRPEKRKGTGEGHEATIRRIKSRAGPDGAVEQEIFEKKAISKVTEKDLQKLEDREPGRHHGLITAVSAWMKEDKKTRPPCPRMPAAPGRVGPEIRSLRLPMVMNSRVPVRGGVAGNGDMVRVDVFRDEKGFWLVPIYTHQLADKVRYPTPPMLACVGGKPPAQWQDMAGAQFLFSLYSWSLVRMTDRNGDVTEAYYRKMNINDACIVTSQHNDSTKLTKAGVKTLRDFQKLHVDLLGNRSLIKREPRLWHGVACM